MTAPAAFVPARASDAVRRSDLVRTGVILRAVPRSAWRNPSHGIHRQERDYSPHDPAIQARARRLAKRERDYEAGLWREGTGEIIDRGGWMD